MASDNSVPRSGSWLNRNVFGMGLTSLLCDAGHEMATAVLAGFLAVIGAPVYSLGIIEGVADALSSFVKLGAGWWSDRLGHRKAITTAGYALTGVRLRAVCPGRQLAAGAAGAGGGLVWPRHPQSAAECHVGRVGCARRSGQGVRFPSRRRYAGRHSWPAGGGGPDVLARSPTPARTALCPFGSSSS